jgi:hypothetical protein
VRVTFFLAGNAPCLLDAAKSAAGDTATFSAGQTCTITSMNISGTWTVQSGTLRRTGGAQLDLDATGPCSGTPLGVAASGTVDVTFSRARS